MDTFDGSDVMDSSDATLATVVENTKRINLDDTAGSEELSSIINNQGEDDGRRSRDSRKLLSRVNRRGKKPRLKDLLSLLFP